MTDDGSASPVGLLGIPFALGGWIPEMSDAIVDMTRTPQTLRRGGLVADLGARSRRTIVDLGDVDLQPSYCIDGSNGVTNRELAAQHLPKVRSQVRDSVQSLGSAAQLVTLGGECTIHPAVLAGLRDTVDQEPVGLIWFDAHGDFNTPETTQTGSIWGFPLAMSCGRGDPLLVASSGGGAVAEENVALLGGHAMDEAEGRLVASSQVSHFGTGMLETDAGLAAFAAWLGVVAQRVRGVYVAFDMDVLDDSGGSAVALPEPNGMPVATARRVLEIAAEQTPVVGIGFTTLALSNGDSVRAGEVVAELGGAVLAGPVE